MQQQFKKEIFIEKCCDVLAFFGPFALACTNFNLEVTPAIFSSLFLTFWMLCWVIEDFSFPTSGRQKFKSRGPIWSKHILLGYNWTHVGKSWSRGSRQWQNWVGAQIPTQNGCRRRRRPRVAGLAVTVGDLACTRKRRGPKSMSLYRSRPCFRRNARGVAALFSAARLAKKSSWNSGTSGFHCTRLTKILWCFGLDSSPFFSWGSHVCLIKLIWSCSQGILLRPNGIPSVSEDSIYFGPRPGQWSSHTMEILGSRRLPSLFQGFAQSWYLGPSCYILALNVDFVIFLRVRAQILNFGNLTLGLESSGSGRFKRIKKAVDEGASAAPVDLRYLKKAKFAGEGQCSSVPGVISFLESVYNSIAENLPDVRDGPCDLDADGGLDPYAADDVFKLAMTLEPADEKVKVKKHKRGVQVHPDRTVAAGCEIRWLPPGCVKDYWVQYKQTAGDSAASFPTFWRDTQLRSAARFFSCLRGRLMIFWFLKTFKRKTWCQSAPVAAGVGEPLQLHEIPDGQQPCTLQRMCETQVFDSKI